MYYNSDFQYDLKFGKEGETEIAKLLKGGCKNDIKMCDGAFSDYINAWLFSTTSRNNT